MTRILTDCLGLKQVSVDMDGQLDLPRESMNKLIMNYLVTEGFKEAAEKLQEEAGVAADVDLKTMDSRIRVRDAIQMGHIEEATMLINQMHPELLDDNEYLMFHLEQQQLIELIRQGKIEEALKFATDQLAEKGAKQPAVLEELERTMALLAFENPEQSPFADLLSSSHRHKIASEANAAILKAEHVENPQSKLSICLKLILWAQSELDRKKIKYTKITNLANGSLDESK